MLTRARLLLRDAAPDSAVALELLGSLIAVFPSLEIGVASERVPSKGLADIDAGAWRAPRCDVSAFDGRMLVFDARDGAVDIAGSVADVATVAASVLTRYQRYISRRNVASRGAVFDRIFALHCAKEDREPEFRRGRYVRSRDVLHWALRIDPFASLPLQAAALFLDVARLDAHGSTDDETSGRPAEALDRLFDAARIDKSVREDAVGLVARIEDVAAGEASITVFPGSEVSVLRDADALAFFSLDIDDRVDGLGVEVARGRIRAQLARLSAPARDALRWIRLRSDVAKLVAQEQRALVRGGRLHEPPFLGRPPSQNLPRAREPAGPTRRLSIC